MEAIKLHLKAENRMVTPEAAQTTAVCSMENEDCSDYGWYHGSEVVYKILYGDPLCVARRFFSKFDERYRKMNWEGFFPQHPVGRFSAFFSYLEQINWLAAFQERVL